MPTITLRTGSGVASRTVEIVKKVTVGLADTHNKDGRYVRSYAVDAVGDYYETKPKGGGWRKATRVADAKAALELS